MFTAIPLKIIFWIPLFFLLGVLVLLAVIADKEELLDAKEGSIGDLFEGVWDVADIVLGSEESAHVQCAKVLRNWYPNLFDKDNPKEIG